MANFIKSATKKSLLALVKGGQMTARGWARMLEALVTKDELEAYVADSVNSVSVDFDDYVKRDGTTALTNNWDAGSWQIRAETLRSDVATGTAPLTVASTTLVDNLNADTVDGTEESAFAYVDGTRAFTGNVEIETASTASLRLADGGSATEYTDISNQAGSAFFDKVAATSCATFWNPKPTDGTGTATAGVFRTTNTSGLCEFRVHIGNGTVSLNNVMRGIGNSDFCTTSGNVNIGTTGGNEKLNVAGDASISTDLKIGASDAIKINYASGDAYFIADNNAASDLILSTGTAKTLELETPVWNDLRVPALSVKVPTSGNPGFSQFKDNGAGSTGVFLYWFDPTAEEEVYFVAQLPHSYKQGTDIEPHVHWVSADTAPASGTDVCWGLEYTWANVNGTFGNTTIIYGDEQSNGSGETITVDKHYLTDLGTITGTSKNISSMLVCRLFRDATGAGGTDDYDDDAGLLEIDFHFQIDTIGSRTETAK